MQAVGVETLGAALDSLTKLRVMPAR